MKIFISADIEGVAGIFHRNECDKTHLEYREFAEQMTLEVKAACEGAIAAGAKEIVIKDAHATARNITHKLLPENTKLIRGWSGHPHVMMQGIDESFDAAIFIGYHSAATSSKNSLSHTLNGRLFHSIKINGMLASEFLVNTYTSNFYDVPVVFMSGDYDLCQEGQKLNNNLMVVSTIKGVGQSVIGNHPKTMIDQIQKEVHLALKKDLGRCKVDLPKTFKVEIEFKQHMSAYKNSFYPGMKQKNDTTVIFETKNYFEVLKMLSFMT